MSDKTNTPADITYSLTREDWLHRAAKELGSMIHQVSGIEVPAAHISMGFGGLSYERGVRGVCWHTSRSDDNRNHVFISPELNDTGVVLLVLLHELIHVALNNADGHKKMFAEIATRLGLTAPFTTATPDIELTAQLMVIAAELGEFPHAGLHARVAAPVGDPVTIGAPGTPVPISSGPRQQVNRWVSVTCPSHGGSVRLSRTALAEGAPFCGRRDEQGIPCLTEMIAKG